MIRALRSYRGIVRTLAALAAVGLMLMPLPTRAQVGTGSTATSTAVADFSGLTAEQQAVLLGIARDTWKFYSVDLDPGTHLPMDNVTFGGGSATPTSYGRYTSAANIGVYMWAVVAAADLGLVSHADAVTQLTAVLNEVGQL